MTEWPPNVNRVRAESFGGIWQTVDPAALVWVDRPAMRAIGWKEDPRWTVRSERLSAPTEAHLALTNRCDAACPTCYMASGRELPNELSTDEWKRVLDRLRAMGVFHVALGGGESTLRSDLFGLARYARSIGLIPNLTSNGLGITEANAAEFGVFGIVNLSLDGLGETFRSMRGYDGSQNVQRALEALKDAGVAAGINCVVARPNFGQLEEIVRWARGQKLSEIEFLRLKPVGRARDRYHEWKLNPAQGLAFIRDLRRWSRRYRPLKLKIDCSFVPFLASAGASARMMRVWGVTGCEGANVLVGVKADGRFGPCSFSTDMGGRIDALPAVWESDPRLKDFLKATRQPAMPCRACRHRDICRGGCHAVTEFLTGSIHGPDPECPRVIRWRTWTARLAGWIDRLPTPR